MFHQLTAGVHCYAAGSTTAAFRSARKTVAPKKSMAVSAGPIGDTKGMSAEQIAFLKRRAGLIPDYGAAGSAGGATHGGAALKTNAPAPKAAAPAPAGGLSAEQIAFMERKKAEAAGQPFAGYGAGAANTHGAPSGAAAPKAAAPKAAAPAAA
eukprot:8016574-Pyramimonas_sp.AAC.1